MRQDRKSLPADATRQSEARQRPSINYAEGRPPIALINYTLSTVCPNCSAETLRRACKVICERCGFMWDCSEL